MDMDQDGQQEIVAAEGVYSFTWSESDSTFTHGLLCETGFPGGLPAVADVDGDGLGELVVISEDAVGVFEYSSSGGQCPALHSWELPASGYSPALADFDGDTLPELAVAFSSGVGIYEMDGTSLWEELPDRSATGAAGLGAHDMDGDGYFELVYAGAESLVIYQEENARLKRELEASEKGKRLLESQLQACAS